MLGCSSLDYSLVEYFVGSSVLEQCVQHTNNKYLCDDSTILHSLLRYRLRNKCYQTTPSMTVTM